jgi:hypothetical protein
MARPTSGRRIRLSIPPRHPVLRYLESLDDSAEASSEILRLAEIAVNIEELCGPVRTLADMVRVLNLGAIDGLPSTQASPGVTAPLKPPHVATNDVETPGPMRSNLPAARCRVRR